MKTIIQDKQVTLVSENPREAKQLIDFVLSELVTVEANAIPPTTKKHKAHKKHAHGKPCRYCHKLCKGNMGRAVHEARAHTALYKRDNAQSTVQPQAHAHIGLLD